MFSVKAQMPQIHWLFFLLFPKQNLVLIQQIKLQSTVACLTMQSFQNIWVGHLDSSSEAFCALFFFLFFLRYKETVTPQISAGVCSEFFMNTNEESLS